MNFAECYGREISKSIIEKDGLNDDIIFACGLTEIVHNGSLIHDDVEDASLKRRGEPCTYLKYGSDYAINTGCLMYYLPIMKLGHYIKDPST